MRPVGHSCAAGQARDRTLVPVDFFVCQAVHRLRLLRAADATGAGGFLLARPRGRYPLIRGLRAVLRDVVAAAGITTRIVPHQFRHTYGTEMLRAGVNFAAVMKLLGHKSPHMTLQYLEVTQLDLQREYRLARSHPRHLTPPTHEHCSLLFRALTSPVCSTPSRLHNSSRDVPPRPSRRIQSPRTRAPRQPPRQDRRPSPEPQITIRVGRDWPVNPVSWEFDFGHFYAQTYDQCLQGFGLFDARFLKTSRHQMLNDENALDRRATSTDFDAAGVLFQTRLDASDLSIGKMQGSHRSCKPGNFERFC
ncbi:MAG: hypothetical protein DMG57_11775 [Acidobacteria bacterium]|nr:MAG: hypothetical protein DMG57_11775 [Acidobacteriota bacterium]